MTNQNKKGLWFFIVGGVSTAFYANVLSNTFMDQFFIPNRIGFGGMCATLALSLYALVRYYRAWWNKVGAYSFVGNLYDKFVFPLLFIIAPIGYLTGIGGSVFTTSFLVISPTTLISGTLLYVVLSDPGNRVTSFLSESKEFKSGGSDSFYLDLFFSKFPPRNFSDMLGLHVAVHILLIVPLFLL